MRRFIAVALGGMLCLFVASAQQVKIDFDHGADFTRYHTYMWGAIQKSPEVSQLGEQRINASIDEGLASRGLRRVEANADLVVTYHAAVKQQMQLTTYNSGGYGWGWGGGSGISTTTEDQIPVGTLVVDLLDPHQRQLVYRATATDTLSSKPEKNQKKLTKAVKKMFEKYPPGSK